MPKPLRPLAPGLIYQAFNRGNNRQTALLGEGDHEAFLAAPLDLLQRKLFEGKAERQSSASCNASNLACGFFCWLIFRANPVAWYCVLTAARIADSLTVGRASGLFGNLQCRSDYY